MGGGESKIAINRDNLCRQGSCINYRKPWKQFYDVTLNAKFQRIQKSSLSQEMVNISQLCTSENKLRVVWSRCFLDYLLLHAEILYSDPQRSIHHLCL